VQLELHVLITAKPWHDGIKDRCNSAQITNDSQSVPTARFTTPDYTKKNCKVTGQHQNIAPPKKKDSPGGPTPSL
jgi:hypothetical protein